ncbi:MAG TPA: transposase [Thermoguttaceae bacterium]
MKATFKPVHKGAIAMFEEAFDLFAKAAPATVMIRGLLENILSAPRLDAIFEAAAETQYTRKLAFSSVVRLMSQVVMRIQPSPHAAYRGQAEELDVSAKCVYDKLEGIEPIVSRELLSRTAREMELVIKTMGSERVGLLPGFRTKILDGNHLAGTDRRLKPLRGQKGSALPGQALAVLDPALKLVIDLFPCEDAYTQERALVPQVLETVERNDFWIADRNFCTTVFLFGVSRKQAFFLVRQHAQSLRWKVLEEPVFTGEIAAGRVFQQPVCVLDENGVELLLRRIRIELRQPTRDGEKILHLLTNLAPTDADALSGAGLYCERWQIETAFQELTVDLACEVQTLGYPKAALFAFAVAVVCYNAFSVIKAALRTQQSTPSAVPPHGSDSPVPRRKKAAAASAMSDELSTYYLASEIAGNWQGMTVVLPDTFWEKKFAALNTGDLARCLTELAGRADVSKYRKRPPSPKRSPQQSPCQPGSHVSTARMLKIAKYKLK